MITWYRVIRREGGRGNGVGKEEGRRGGPSFDRQLVEKVAVLKVGCGGAGE